MIAMMLILVLAVAATAAAVLFWFFSRLRRIETDLWGEKRQEAVDTATQSATEGDLEAGTP